MSRYVWLLLIVACLCHFTHLPGCSAAVKTAKWDAFVLRLFSISVKQSSGDGNATRGINGWFTDTATDPCRDAFPGVSCTNDASGFRSRVTMLLLDGMGLQGQSAAINSLAYLNALTYLSAKSNSFTGRSPQLLSRLRKLKHLDLSYNSFRGAMPDYSRVPLQALLMRKCGLTGALPTTLASMKKLLQLDLSSNNLTGTIPSLLTKQLTQLMYLDLHDNKFTGPVPPLSKLTNLLGIDLSHNPFTPGPIPSDVTSLPLLGPLDLSSMNLKGSLIDLSALAGVTDILMGNNQLEGSIDPRLLPNQTLGYFWAPNNKFTGTVSEGFLDAFAYPSYALIDCGLVLANNSLTGPLPLSLASMTQSYVFDFSNNQMTGTLPADYAHIFAIQRVILSNNQFSGTIPASFGTSDSLRQLILDGNQFSGTIPSLSGSSRLLTLDLSRNKFAGTFPDVSSLQYLSTIRVVSNQLAGALPSATLSLASLKTADFSSNFFSGTRPSAPPAFSLANNCFKQQGCSGTAAQCWQSDSRAISQCQDFCSADAAAPNVCSNHGHCVSSNGLATCQCDTGFTANAGFTCASGQSAIHSAAVAVAATDTQSYASVRVSALHTSAASSSSSSSRHSGRPGSLRELVFAAAAKQGRLPAWMMKEVHIGVGVRGRLSGKKQIA